jgi:uncharacterized protein
MRNDEANLALAKRFFDAIEQKDYATVEACYAPEAIVWHSHDCLYEPRESNLAMLERGIQSERRVEYTNRRVRAFEGGFVQQHTIYVNWENGFRGKMDVCFVAYTRDSKLSRIYEYFDTGRREEFLGPQSATQPN